MTRCPDETERRPHPTTTTTRREVGKPGAWSVRRDEDLLAEYVAKGAQEAFEELIHRYEHEMYSYLRRYLRRGTGGRRFSGHFSASASQVPRLRSVPEISAVALQDCHQPRDRSSSPEPAAQCSQPECRDVGAWLERRADVPRCFKFPRGGPQRAVGGSRGSPANPLGRGQVPNTPQRSA